MDNKTISMFSVRSTYNSDEPFTVTFRVRNTSFSVINEKLKCYITGINSQFFRINKEIDTYYNVRLVETGHKFDHNCTPESGWVRLHPYGYIEESYRFVPKKDVAFPSQPLQLEFVADYKDTSIKLPITIVNVNK